MKVSFALLAVITATASAQVTCETQRSDCDTQIGANHACCGSLYASCTAGTTSPDSSFGQCSNGPPCPTCTGTVPAATATSVSSACAAQQSSCDSQIGANHACCGSLYASCLAGTTSPISPFDQCSNGPPCPTCTGTGVVSSTQTSSAPASTLSAACAAQQTACDSQIGANHACCGSLFASCTAGTTSPDSSFGQCSNGPPCPTCTGTIPAATATSVSSACAVQQNSCDSQIGANHACCGSLYASCLAGTTSPESPFDQCSNGPPCPTCTGTAPAATGPPIQVAVNSTSTTSSSSSLTSPSSPAEPFTGAAYANHVGGGLVAAGLAIVALL